MKCLLAAGVVSLLLSSSSTSFAQTANWGLLANPGTDSHGVPWDGQAVKSTYFFPGEGSVVLQSPTFAPPGGSCVSSIYFGASCNFSSYCGAHQDPNTCQITNVGNGPLYTFLPDNPNDLLWHTNGTTAQDATLTQMLGAHVNVVTMSYWVGAAGNTSDWVRSAPMQVATCSSNGTCPADELFDAAVRKNILVLPAIDGIKINDYLKDNSSWSSSNPIVVAIELLLRRYILSPPQGHPGWPYQWALVHDKNGVGRPAIMLLHVASDWTINGTALVQSLDALRDRIRTDTGWQVGFTIDPVGSKNDLTPQPAPTDGYVIDKNTPFETQDSFLAIEEYFPERFFVQMNTPDYDNNAGYCGTDTVPNTFADVVSKKRQWIQGFLDRHVPVYLDVIPGYDGRYVFQGSGVIGDNSGYYDDDWRNTEAQLTGLSPYLKGYVFTAWNAYTEGMVAVPSKRILSNQTHCGTHEAQCVVANTAGADDVQLRWMTDLFANDPWNCTVNYYEQYGATKNLVYGAICQEWRTMGGSAGYGEPDNNQSTTRGYAVSTYCTTHKTSTGSFACMGPGANAQGYGGNGTGGQFNKFSSNTKAIYWGAGGAFPVYGAILQEYLNQREDAGFLGLPLSGEEPSGACNGVTNQFQGGWIDFCWSPRSWPYPGCAFGNVCAHP